MSGAILMKGAVEEFRTYIEHNRSVIPHEGERYRQSERISTGFVESTVNQVVSKQMVKKQQMAGSQGARICCCRAGRVCETRSEKRRSVGGIPVFDHKLAIGR